MENEQEKTRPVEDQDDEKLGSLLNRKEEATEIGFLIMYLANLEIYLIPAMSRLLRGNSALANVIVSNIDNVGAKLSIFFDIAQLRSSTAFGSAILLTKPDVLKAVAFRNAIAHSHFGNYKSFRPSAISESLKGEENTLILIQNVISARRGKPAIRKVKPAIVRHHVNALRHLIKVIRDEVGSSLRVFLPEEMQFSSPDKPSQANQPRKSPRQVRKERHNRSPPES